MAETTTTSTAKTPAKRSTTTRKRSTTTRKRTTTRKTGVRQVAVEEHRSRRAYDRAARDPRGRGG